MWDEAKSYWYIPVKMAASALYSPAVDADQARTMIFNINTKAVAATPSRSICLHWGGRSEAVFLSIAPESLMLAGNARPRGRLQLRSKKKHQEMFNVEDVGN